MRILIAFITLAFITGCTKDPKFSSASLFVADPEAPALPAYSELGYNTYGAYYNNEVWVSSKLIAFDGAHVKDDSLVFDFNGVSNYVNFVRFVNLRLLVTKTDIKALSDLSNLNNRTIDLTTDRARLKVNDSLVNIQSGTFNIKRSRRLIVDGGLFGMVLSGTFNITGTINAESVNFRSGRFDVIISQSLFSQYEFKF